MTPQLVLLESPPEVNYLEEMFERHQYPRNHSDKVLKTILFLMRSNKNVEAEVPGWIERFRYSEPVVGELLYRPMQTLCENFHRHFTVWGMYLPDGQMPYAYSKQEGECSLFLFDEAYASLRSKWQKEIPTSTLF